jgi:diguanylate cyclase (GGDEF)-like protein
MNSMGEMETSYNLSLVALSYIIAVIASFTALDLSRRVHFSSGVAARYWLFGGAFSMGSGIWSMHFIGMLAINMPINIGYDIPMTTGSLLAATAASALALKIISIGRLSINRLISGGIIMGIGICIMHYVGMAAMQIQSSIRYDYFLLTVSIVIAISASIVALWLAFYFNSSQLKNRSLLPQRLFAAAVMGGAIAGMHYTGIAAAYFPSSVTIMQESIISPMQFAGGVALASASIMTITLLLSVYDSNMASNTARLTGSLELANEELQYLALHDSLTKLPNRVLLKNRIEQTIASTTRNHSEFALLFVDLDNFKIVNDTMGHHIGDELIKLAAERLLRLVRPIDTVARIGGDEFLIALSHGVMQHDITEIASRIIDDFSTVFLIDANEIRISLSIGISCYPQDGQDVHNLITHADVAMHYSKEMGRNNFHFFKPEMSLSGERRRRLGKKLRIAVEKNLLSIAYQPKTDVSSGNIVGAEALARWHDADLGTIPPDEFIPLAEDLGLIFSLGEWVLLTACKQAKLWQDKGWPKLEMAVNVSAYQLNKDDFKEVVIKALNTSGLASEYLELEVTESAVMRNPARAQKVLEELHEMGIKLSVDDFGTGYSNLSKLKSFPVDRLKIDRSFVSGISSNPQDAAIVKGVIALAHSLNFTVVAEGVETDEQLTFIHNHKGEQYQGYLCSKPLCAKDFEDFFETYAHRDNVKVYS